MNKVIRILGKRGRTTLPYEIRKCLGMCAGDVISFETKDGDYVLVKREQICSSIRQSCQEKPVQKPENGPDCNARIYGSARVRGQAKPVQKPRNEESLLEFLDGLSLTEQRAALIHLSAKWAAQERRRNHD